MPGVNPAVGVGDGVRVGNLIDGVGVEQFHPHDVVRIIGGDFDAVLVDAFSFVPPGIPIRAGGDGIAGGRAGVRPKDSVVENFHRRLPAQVARVKTRF
jgi:hypothetical protein